jgi:hypothetical protein
LGYPNLILAFIFVRTIKYVLALNSVFGQTPLRIKHLNHADAIIAPGYSFQCTNLRQISQQMLGHAHRVVTTDTTIANTTEDSAKFLHFTSESGAEDAATAASSGA